MSGPTPALRRPWQPILHGAAAAAVRAVVDEIAAALDVDPAGIESAALSGGAAGRALLYAYLAETFPGEGHEQRAERWLDRAIDLLGSQPMPASLHGGFTGIAWVAEHLGGDPDADAGDDANQAIDETLAELLDTTPWPDHYDLIGGLVGLGTYAIERLPRPIAAGNLARVVARLDDLAIERDGGLTWLTRPDLMIPVTRADYPDGYYNMGVAHGVPGAIAVLAAAVAGGVAVPAAARLLDGAWRWVMANRLPAAAETTFPFWIGPGETPSPARSAWCYGDPGAAAAMCAAARLIGDDARTAEGLAIARRAAERPVDRCGCVDAGLCHGTAGLALIYHRLWQQSGDARFAEAARQWYRETLARRRPGRGVAGFESYRADRGWYDDPSFLTGAAGVALALLAGISSVEPAWDRVLLVSLPPAGLP